jgi:hypothetical protein
MRGFNSPTPTGDMLGQSSGPAAVVPSTIGSEIRHPAIRPITLPNRMSDVQVAPAM